MPCPRCHSHRLWDDNLAWGCCDCEFFTTGGIRNTGDIHKDVFHAPAAGGGWKPEKDSHHETNSTDRPSAPDNPGEGK